MRQRHLVYLLGGVFLVGGAIAACSDSSGPSRASCTSSTPNLTGTWSLVSVDIGATGSPIPAPPASGSFTFSGANVTTDLHIPSPPFPNAPLDIVGTGTCHLTADSIFITNFGAFGDANGSYDFFPKGATGSDTLKATLNAQGVPNDVVVAR